MAASAVVYLEKINSSVGDTKLRVEITKVEEDIANKVLKLPYPKISESKQNTESPVTKYKDLKRVTHVFTLSGYVRAQQNQSASEDFYDANIVVKGADSSSPTYLTAAQAKNALIYYILYPYGDINLYWRGCADADATPSTDLADLMLASDVNRKNTVVFDKIKFIDAPGLRAEFDYSANSSFSQAESNAEKYDFTMTLTKGVLF